MIAADRRKYRWYWYSCLALVLALTILFAIAFCWYGTERQKAAEWQTAFAELEKTVGKFHWGCGGPQTLSRMVVWGQPLVCQL